MLEKLVLNSDGVRELLKSSEMEKICKTEAEKIRSKCGSGYAVDTKTMGTRVIASVYTEDIEAMRDNLTNNTLLKAIP